MQLLERSLSKVTNETHTHDGVCLRVVGEGTTR
jgi:hypothetical protein